MVKNIKSSKEDTPLVAAKQIYTDQLIGCILPVVYEGLLTLYSGAVEQAETQDDILYLFQQELKNVPKWNSDVIRTETKRIEESCDFFNDLLTAVFVSNVRILSSVKLGNKKTKKVNITVPTNDSFVHSIYMNCAKQIYTNPYLYSINQYDPITDNTTEVYAIIEKATLDTIRNLLPLKSILESFLGNAMSSDDETDDDEGSEKSDDETKEAVEQEEKEIDQNDDASDIDDNDHVDEDRPPHANEPKLMEAFFDRPEASANEADIKDVHLPNVDKRIIEQYDAQHNPTPSQEVPDITAPRTKPEKTFFDDV